MTTNTAPDETALRLPEFQPGVAIVLSDGQPWHFRMPVVGDYYPSPGKDGKLRFRAGSDLGIAYDDLVDRYVDAPDAGAEFEALSALAFDLLRRNYAVEPGHLRFLLRLSRAGASGAKENAEMWAMIAAAALGNAPTPAPDEAPAEAEAAAP